MAGDKSRLCLPLLVGPPGCVCLNIFTLKCLVGSCLSLLFKDILLKRTVFSKPCKVVVPSTHTSSVGATHPCSSRWFPWCDYQWVTARGLLLQSHIIFQNLIIYSLLCCRKYLCNASMYCAKIPIFPNNIMWCRPQPAEASWVAFTVGFTVDNPCWLLQKVWYQMKEGKKLSINALLQTYT